MPTYEFHVTETGTQDARPVELMSIVLSGQSWYLTSADVPIVKDGITYEPTPMLTGTSDDITDVSKSNIVIKIPRDHPARIALMNPAFIAVTSITIFSGHFGLDEYLTRWKGRVLNIELDEVWCNMTSESVFSSLQRMGVRRRCSFRCPHALYDTRCKVDKSKFAITVRVVGDSSIYGNRLEVDTPIFVMYGAAPAANNSVRIDAGEDFEGGLVEWVKNGIAYSLPIGRFHTYLASGIFNLPRNVGLEAGDLVTYYPGCNKNFNTCATKFQNQENFGGHPFVPQINPFAGTSIY